MASTAQGITVVKNLPTAKVQIEIDSNIIGSLIRVVVMVDNITVTRSPINISTALALAPHMVHSHEEDRP